MIGTVANRVRETWTGTGTGSVNLAGADSGYQTFVAGLGTSTGDTTGPWTQVAYVIINTSDSTEWEMGLATVTDASPDTLARTTVLDSSNSGSLVNFSSGTKAVLCGPSHAQFPRMWIVSMTLSADETVAGGATEDLTGFTAALDPFSLVSSGNVTTPYDAYVYHTATYLTDDTGGTSGGVAPNLKIDGTGDQYGNGSGVFTTPHDSFSIGNGRWFSVDKDDVIVPQGYNYDSNTSRDVEAGSTFNLLFIERFV